MSFSPKICRTFLYIGQDTIQCSGCWIAVKHLQSATSIICSTVRSLLQQKLYLKAVRKTALIVPRNSAVTKPSQAGIAYLILLTVSADGGGGGGGDGDGIMVIMTFNSDSDPVHNCRDTRIWTHNDWILPNCQRWCILGQGWIHQFWGKRSRSRHDQGQRHTELDIRF